MPGRVLSSRGLVDQAQVGGHALALLPAAGILGMPYQVNDAGLDRGFREGGGDRLGESFQPVHNRNQDVLNAPAARLVHHRQPEFGALVVRNPEAQDLALSIPGDAQGDADRLVLQYPAAGITDLHPESVKNDNGLHPVQRPVLPVADLIRHGIGDTADQIRRNPQAMGIIQMSLNIAH